MNQKFLKIELPLIIYLFLLLFLPPIVKNVNLLIFLSFISFLILVIKYYDESLQIIKSKHVSKVIKYLLLYYFWYFFILLINGLMTKNFYWYNYFITFYSMILVFPLIFICILCIVIYCKKNDLSFDDIVKCIIYAGLIQSAFTLLSFIFPWFKTFLINIMYNNTGEILYKNSYSLRRRFFGFANNLLDSFGYGTGIIAILPLFYSIKNGKKWLYTMPFLLLVPTLNSRTGLVVFGIGFIFWIIYCIKEKIIQKYLKLIMYLVSSVFLVFSIVYIFYPTTIGWILNDFLSFFHITSGTAGVLFSKSFMTLPSNFFNLIFGAGYTVAAYGGIVDKIGFGSDVGYINEIWKTGLIGVVFLSYLFIKMLNKVKQKLPKEYKYFTLFLIISTFVVNIKFYVFTCNSGMTIIILLYLFTIYNLSIKPKNVINEKIDEQELISVIVPVYNIEKYLNRCLTSIVNQTYKKIEIILINDGSTDNSEQICKEFAQKDDRIKYFKQKNQGLSAARNTGMEHATGNYYVFIDSDDYVNVHFIESLYSALKTANTKLAVCNYKKVYEDLENIQTTGDGQIEIIDNEYKYDYLYNNERTTMTVAWNKIYKKELFDDLKYPEGKIHEDEYIICDVLNKVDKIAYIDNDYYYYYQREGSITGSYKLNRTDILEALRQKMEFFKKKNYKRYYGYALYDYYYQLLNQKKLLKQFYPDQEKLIQDIDKNIEKYKKPLLTNIFINPLKKVKILLIMKGIIAK